MFRLLGGWRGGCTSVRWGCVSKGTEEGREGVDGVWESDWGTGWGLKGPGIQREGR